MGINTNPNPQVNNPRPIYGPSYNAVQINMDTPTVNAPQQPVIYGYPQADGQIYYPPMPQQPTIPGQQPPTQQPPAQQPAVDGQPKTDAVPPTADAGNNNPPKFDIEKVLANFLFVTQIIFIKQKPRLKFYYQTGFSYK